MCQRAGSVLWYLSFALRPSNSALPAAVYSVHRLWCTHRHHALAGGIVVCFLRALCWLVPKTKLKVLSPVPCGG
nr:MAG TPA: hypothetical protein [Caudoviricetes sp.]